MQVGGSNYLVPVDAELANTAALDFEMVRLDLVQRTMERETATNVLFLDACRDNPLARNLARAMGTRSTDIGRGLAAAESGVGTLISFSTQPGNVALDGSGRNSPYAAALVKGLAAPGEDLSAMLIGVRNEVMAATHNRQVPWEHSALRARLYLTPPGAAADSTPPSGAQGSISQAPTSAKTPVAHGEAAAPPKTAIAARTASVEQDRPTPIAAGETVRGRVGERKASHYWKVDAQPGKYHVVIDVKRADDAHSNIQSSILALAGNGRPEKIVRLNEIEFRARAVGEIDTAKTPDVVLRVDNESSIVDYWLGLFPLGVKVAAPYFARTPRIEPLPFGKPVSALLEPMPETPAEAWYAVRLQGIDYRISIEFKRTDGVTSNVQGSVDIFGPMGERLSGMKGLCHVNAVDVMGKCSTKLSLADEAQVLLRLSPGNAANYTATLTVEPLNP